MRETIRDTDSIPNYKRTLFHFKVMYSGWECDDDAWVVELKDGSRALVTTTHCSTYVAETGEFEEKLEKYAKVVSDTQKALAMVGVVAKSQPAIP